MDLAPAARPDVERRRHQPHRPAGRCRGEAFVDEVGRLFLASDLGLGIVHTLDMDVASDAVERGVWQPREARFAALVERFGYRLSPAAGDA